MNESSCIYREVSSWFWVENLGFFHKPIEKRNGKTLFLPDLVCIPPQGSFVLSAGNMGFTMCFAHSGRVGAHPRQITSAPYSILPFSSFFWVLPSFKLVLRLGKEFPQVAMYLEASWIFIPCIPESSWGVIVLPNYMIF